MNLGKIMAYRYLILLMGIAFLNSVVAEELELICIGDNSESYKHEVYVLYQKESTSYAYLDGKKYGFGTDFWEYEQTSENQRTVYSAYYGSDELIFWRKNQTLEDEQWKFVDQHRFHINRITGNFKVDENEQFRSKGKCSFTKIKKL